MVMTIKQGTNKKEITKRLTALYNRTRKGFDARKFCGVLQLEEDALAIQKRLRDEWE